MTQSEEPKINKPASKGWKRMFSTIKYAIKGLKAAWKYEESLRQETIIMLLAIPCAYLLARSWAEFILLFGSLVLVLIVELLNSALETIVDRISLEHHELSGRAKDIGSSAAFVSMVLTGIIWSSLLLIRIFS